VTRPPRLRDCTACRSRKSCAGATGNLPALIGPDAGILVPPGAGPGGLRAAARDLLADPLRYYLACGAEYCRSRNYRSADVAQTFLKAVL
jgi:hypothetical protein